MADKVGLAKLRQLIPGLTRYRFMVARQNALIYGSGTLVPTNPQTRTLIPEVKLSHISDFITSSHVIQDLPFGAKTIIYTTNKVIQVPIPEVIVRQYEPTARSLILHLWVVAPSYKFYMYARLQPEMTIIA